MTASIVGDYGYLAVAGSLFLDNMGVPAASEGVLMVAALLAVDGHLDLVVLCLLALAAVTAGATAGYVLGRYGGRPIVERHHRLFRVTPQRLDRAQRLLDRHLLACILLARFVPVVRCYFGITAGISGVRWPRYLFSNLLSASIWVAAFTVLGATAGHDIDQINSPMRDLALVVALIFLALLQLGRRRGRRRSLSTQPQLQDSEAPSPSHD